ncbi:hypothetical protein RFI_31879, partial [Reticulomyxa filosa]
SRFSKAELMKKGILEKKDNDTTIAISGRNATATAEYASRPQHSILQERGILKLTKEPMTMITDSENVAQLDKQNEDSIATKRHYEPAPSHIFSNELVNKVALDQITKGYFTTHNRRLADDDTLVDNNDVNESSMIWQVQDHKRNYYNNPYYSIARDYVVSVIKYIGKFHFVEDDRFSIKLDAFNKRETIVKRLENGNHNEEVFFEVGDCVLLKDKPRVSLSFFLFI